MKTFKTIVPHDVFQSHHEELHKQATSVPVSQLADVLRTLQRPIWMQVLADKQVYELADHTGRFLHVHMDFERAVIILIETLPELWATWVNTASTQVVLR